MARPAKSGAPMTHTVSIRLTDAERAHLLAKFGTVYKALRTLVTREVEGAKPNFAQPTLHRHRRGVEIERTLRSVSYACADPECGHILKEER